VGSFEIGSGHRPWTGGVADEEKAMAASDFKTHYQNFRLILQIV
jgi:hypothetical protein